MAFAVHDGIGGTESAVLLVGEALRRCVPGDDTAGNELPNEITLMSGLPQDEL